MVKEGDDLRQDQCAPLAFPTMGISALAINGVHWRSMVCRVRTGSFMGSCEVGVRLVLQLIILMDSILKRYGLRLRPNG